MKFFAFCLILAYFCAVVSAASAVGENNGEIGKRSVENGYENFAEKNIAEYGNARTLWNEAEGTEISAIARSAIDKYKTLKETLMKAFAAVGHAVEATTNTSEALLKLLDYKFWLDVIKATIELPGKAVDSGMKATQEQEEKQSEGEGQEGPEEDQESPYRKNV